MKILDYRQGSDEWLRARLGIPSASQFGRIITPDGKPSASAVNYIDELIAERITEKAIPIYVNDYMIRGTELEPQARAFYEFAFDVDVQQVGFCIHDELATGCSPDGLIGDDGGLEIKCVASHNHVTYLREGKMQKKYLPQIQGCLWITGRQWWDWLAYHPDMESLIIRIYRDDDYIKRLETEVSKALEIIETETKKLRKSHERVK